MSFEPVFACYFLFVSPMDIVTGVAREMFSQLFFDENYSVMGKKKRDLDK